MRTAIRVFSIFSTLWLFLAIGTLITPRPAPIAWLAVVPPIILLAWTFVGHIPERSLDDLRSAMRHVKIWSIAEAVAIVATLLLLNAFHLQNYGIAAVIAIVGLHLFPLAKALKEPRYWVVGVVLLAVSGWDMVGVQRDGLASALAGVTLFLGALSLALKSIRRAIRP